jgi:general transcription factor 3C polypeptide 3 (transcription factor C subunit 4)
MSEARLSVIAIDPLNNDVKMKLAETYEIMNQPRKALELVYQGSSTIDFCSPVINADARSVIDAKKRKFGRSHDDETPHGEGGPGSLFVEKAKERTKGAASNKPTLDQLRALEAEQEKETLRGYAKAQQLWTRVVAAPPEADRAHVEREWFFEVERLVESFRETRRLFQVTKASARCTLSNGPEC